MVKKFFVLMFMIATIVFVACTEEKYDDTVIKGEWSEFQKVYKEYVDGVNVGIKELEGDVDSLYFLVEELNSLIKTGDFGAINDKIVELEESLVNAGGEISKSNERIDKLTDELSTLKGDVNNLKKITKEDIQLTVIPDFIDEYGVYSELKYVEGKGKNSDYGTISISYKVTGGITPKYLVDGFKNKSISYKGILNKLTITRAIPDDFKDLKVTGVKNAGNGIIVVDFYCPYKTLKEMRDNETKNIWQVALEVNFGSGIPKVSEFINVKPYITVITPEPMPI